MTNALEMLIGFFNDLINLLFSFSVDFFGYSVPFGAILVAFLIIGIIVTVFWKGAKA